MASGAKLQKSFQDYFRIPILLKPIDNTSQQTLNQMALVLNQIESFPINEQNLFATESTQSPTFLDKMKKTVSLSERLKNDMKARGNGQSHKLLFLADDFDNDWSEFQIVYRVYFVILVYERGSESNEPVRKGSQSAIGSTGSTLNDKIQKISMRLKQKDKKVLGIIFLNDTEQFSKTLIPGVHFTIIPPSLPLQQLSMFIEPWLTDLISVIESRLIEMLTQCRNQQNTIIVFNRSEEKSEPKIMKKKKKYRCLKICGDLALMLHLYKFAYESYIEADEQLRKVDDWMWVLGCIQGKLACMTCNAQLNIKEEDVEKMIEEVINESFVYAKNVKYQCFEIQNLFKILKLIIHEDKQRFDEMIQTTLGNSKGLTQEQKFLYYSYIGSLYAKASMQRKRNYYYYKASLIIETFKPQVAELLLKTIKQSKYIEEWEELNSKVIQKIIETQNFFNSDGQMHLQLIERCSSVLTEKEIQAVSDYLNYGHFKEKVISGQDDKLIQVKEFNIVQSLIKPKPNRLISDQSPRKPGQSGIFVGWKKKLSYIYEQEQPITFKGTIVNKLPFQIRIKVSIQTSHNSQKSQQFSLILPPSHLYKFQKEFQFAFTEEIISIKKIKFQIWNFILYKTLDPEISFELYEKQPAFDLKVQGGEKAIIDEKERIIVEMEESSDIALRCSLKKINSIECDRLRVTCLVYYDIDVGFQENQFIFSVENNFLDLNLFSQENIPNIKFIESQEKQSSIEYCEQQKILFLKLRKFKTSRKSIKRFEINLDFIRTKLSKYQINKQYLIEPKMINSVWAEVQQISTSQLQTALEGMKNLSQAQIKQFRTNWNMIEDFYLAKIKFFKDKFNLRPFKVWYSPQENSKSQVIGKNEVILTNLTEGQMWIKLEKIRVTTKQKQQLLNFAKNQNEQELIPQRSSHQQYLSFNWQNIVNKNMQGSIRLSIKPCPLIYRPNLQISTQFEKVEGTQKSQLSNSRTYKLQYRIQSPQQCQIKPHKVSVKSHLQNQGQTQSPQSNQSSGNSINILIKGKTRINKIQNSRHAIRQVNEFMNNLTLRVVKQRSNQKIEKQSAFDTQVVVIIQFDQKAIGKWQQVITLA